MGQSNSTSSDTFNFNIQRNYNIFDKECLSDYLYYGHTSKIIDLLNHGYDVNSRGSLANFGSGITLLHIACMKGKYSLFNELIIRGVNIDAVDDNGNTPLYYACQQSLEMVDMLIYNGANVHHINNDGCNMIHSTLCIIPVDLEILSYLIKLKVDSNRKNSLGQTPLYLIIKNGLHENGLRIADHFLKYDKFEVVKTLVVYGVDIDQQSLELSESLGYTHIYDFLTRYISTPTVKSAL